MRKMFDGYGFHEFPNFISEYIKYDVTITEQYEGNKKCKLKVFSEFGIICDKDVWFVEFIIDYIINNKAICDVNIEYIEDDSVFFICDVEFFMLCGVKPTNRSYKLFNECIRRLTNTIFNLELYDSGCKKLDFKWIFMESELMKFMGEHVTKYFVKLNSYVHDLSAAGEWVIPS